MELRGISLVGLGQGKLGGETFHGVDPATGEELEPAFHSATSADLEHAAQLAAAARPIFAALSGTQKAHFLRTIATELEVLGPDLIERAHRESSLTIPRLQYELARTAGQFRYFAKLVEEGSWIDARIDPPIPDRKPGPRADIRSMLRPLGPVAVFGASNFPLAFSVAGGDTASAFAAGCPVIVKAHPAHPGTSELAGLAVRRSIQACELPEGVFSLLFDSGINIGIELVQHSHIKAVGFTGSGTAGKALMKLCAARREPIPCYAEMGSVNPIFVLPGAMAERTRTIAAGMLASVTNGAGQVCTKPGLIFIPTLDSTESFAQTFAEGVAQTTPVTMLTRGIAQKYADALDARARVSRPTLRSRGAGGVGSAPPAALYETTVAELVKHPELAEEVFGPAAVLVRYETASDLVLAAESLDGHLTATIHATETDLEENRALLTILEAKAGRLVFNGYPTGVEVCHAMVHGGPFPATSDSRSSSVGSLAILRFVRPVCFQDFPDAALPAELQRTNPLGIFRQVNGEHRRDPA